MSVQEIYNALLDEQHPDVLTVAFTRELWAQAERQFAAQSTSALSRAQDRDAGERGVR